MTSDYNSYGNQTAMTSNMDTWWTEVKKELKKNFQPNILV